MNLKKALGFFFLISLFCIGTGMNYSTPSTSIVSAADINLATSPGSSDPNQDEWPMFRGQLNHTGATLTSITYGKTAFWDYTFNLSLDSSPTVVGGYVYIGVCFEVGYGDHRFSCLDALTGEFRWKIALQSSIPAVADGWVYVGGYTSLFYCLNATTGGLRWNSSTGERTLSSPAVAGGRVYVGSDDFSIYCLNATTGAQLWNYPTGEYVRSSPAVVDGRVYVGSYDSYFYCLDAITGTQLWNYTTNNMVGSSPAVANGRVYVGSSDYNIYCLNALTGARLWNYTTGSEVLSSPAVANGRVYVGSNDHNFYCLDATTGVRLWNYTTKNIVTSSPAVANGRVYVGSNDHNFYCLNATTGARLWNYTTKNIVGASPAVANGCVYMASSDGNVYCLPTSLDTTPPTYTTVMESADPLELGSTETITISVKDPSGIQTVRIEFGGSNHTMTNQGGGIWRYNTWTPNSTASYPYKIYFQDNAGNWNATTGAILVIDTTPPTYTIVTESADPLELGSMETITISGVRDPSGIQSVLIEFWGGNDTMVYSAGTTWRYAQWTPVTTGVHAYTIYIQDNAGNWKATTGSIQVVVTSTDTIPAYLIPFLIIGAILAASCIIAICLLFWAIRTARPRLAEKSLPPGEKGPKDLVRKNQKGQ